MKSIIPLGKKCSACGNIFPDTLKYFYKKGSGRKGLRAACKWCSCGRLPPAHVYDTAEKELKGEYIPDTGQTSKKATKSELSAIEPKWRRKQEYRIDCLKPFCVTPSGESKAKEEINRAVIYYVGDGKSIHIAYFKTLTLDKALGKAEIIKLAFDEIMKSRGICAAL